MMDFGLSDDQEALQRAARELLAAECPPALVRDTARSDDGVPRALYATLAAQGWLGILVPEALGGAGLGTLELALLCEELGRVVAPGPFLATQLVVAALLRGGTAAQKKRWLPRLAAGEVFGTLAHLEPGDRHDPAGVTARAKRGRGGLVVHGTKRFVPEAPGADVFLVAVRTGRGDGPEGVELVLVERGAPGVRTKPHAHLDLTRRWGDLVLEDVVVADDAVVAGGWPLLARVCDLACVALAADAFGGAQRVLEMAVEYAHVREQFGRKIGSFQAVKHIAAEMVADVAPARSLVWWAAWAQDARPADAARAAAMAKASLSEIYSRTARRSVELHGGIGFTWEFDLQLWFKRAHVTEAAFGDPAFHRERLAALSGW
jgi:alkylation response protein AidB-like acyl-CoA dehydrogenase